jgi:hypothetical protein
VLAPATARAEHDHGGGNHPTGVLESKIGAGVGLVAARYNTAVYIGDYQGVVPQVTWSRGRYAAAASIGLYRLVENGLTRYGVSDVVVSGQATLVSRGRAMAGVALPVSLPTGDQQTGFGMGHIMLMPALWGSAEVRRVQLSASAGYGRALGGSHGHASHGSWPLIDPMNQQELTWTASAYVPLGRALHAGVRASGAFVIGDGMNRAAGGVRAMWTTGRVDTGFEIQAGFAGDPFILRGLLESMVHF